MIKKKAHLYEVADNDSKLWINHQAKQMNFAALQHLNPEIIIEVLYESES